MNNLVSIDPICMSCTHFVDWAICKAFPKGIPQEILNGEFDHHEPWPGGDNNIQFKRIGQKGGS